MAWRRPTAPSDGATAAARPARRSRRVRRLLTVAVVAVLAALLVVVRVPYVIMSPGPAVNTLGNGPDGKPLVTVEGHATYPTTGSLDFTTVSVRGGPGYPVTTLDLVEAWLRPNREILPAAQVFPPDASAEEVKAESSAQMQSSQESATVVALRAIGLTVPEEVLVASVPDDSPAKGLLHADDVVTKVDGVPTPTTEQARAAVRKHEGGERVVVTVTRGGTSRDVTVTAGERDGVAVLGVFLRPQYRFPVDVKVAAGDVGGPSAGTMFALAIYDRLTPGALTGGRRIAGTGALDPDGTVEPIGGIAEKMVAARGAGAEWFLAPTKNCAEVRGHVPDGLHVVSMTSFTDAVTAVTAIGKGSTASLPTCG